MLKLLDKILLSDNVVEDFYTQYQDPEFKNWIISILPELEACRVTHQDHPWHIYTCLEHILHSVEAMNMQTKDHSCDIRRVLAYTMFLHDIGKPECKIRHYSNLYGREVDSFTHHNLASVRVASHVLGKFRFNKDEIATILKLIEEHDAFIPLTIDTKKEPHKQKITPKHIDEIINRLDIDNNGLQMMRYLLMVVRADNLAQNPKMTTSSLKLIEVVGEMLDNIELENNK